MKEKKKEITPGTVIHEEKPFVHVLNSKLRTERCDHCLEKKKLLKCTGCHYVHYCGRVCQKEAWTIHKKECPNIKRVAPKVIPDAARLLSRIVIKLQNGGDLVKSYYSKTSYRKFRDLMSHYGDLKEDKKRIEHFTSLSAVLEEYLHDVLIPNSAELIAMYGRMCVNSFNILDPEMTTIGTGIYLGASIIDHSCNPNALAVFQGNTIYIRTLKSLPTLDWNQVFITYVDLLDTPEERQASLQQSYYFLCQCSLCLDSKQLSYMHSSICPNVLCGSLVDMNNVNDDTEHQCKHCGEDINNEFKTRYKGVVEFTTWQLHEMKNIAYLDVCKMCLQRQQGVLHPLNILHVKTLDMTFEACIQMGNWDYAEDIGKQLLPGFRKYYGEIHPLVGILLLKIGKIMLFKGGLTDALKYIKEADKILSITHGKNHALYKESLLPLLNQVSKEIDMIGNHDVYL